MSERFETLFALGENLYKSGSPIIISAGFLLKDSKTGSIVTQLKFQSVSQVIIRAVKITINAYDISGKLLKGVDEYQYLDLNIKNGEFFGHNKAIVMTDNVTRSINIENILVVLENGIYELNGADLLPLDRSQKLSSEFADIDIIRQYQIDASTDGQFIPLTARDLWICACGKPNSTDICTGCHATKEKVFSAYNPVALNEHLKTRFETEKAEEKRRAEAAMFARQQNEERAKREAANKAQSEIAHKKKIKLYSVMVCVIVATIVAISVISSSIQHKNSITEIEEYISNEKYEHAFDTINQSHLSKDEKRVYVKKIAPKMQEQYDDKNGEYQVLNVDGLPIYERNNILFYYDENGNQIDLYKCREADGQYRDLGDGVKYWIGGERIHLGFDYIYANGYILFIEYGEEIHNDKIETTYKYIRSVNIETGMWETLDYDSHSTCFKKLYDGRILLDQYYYTRIYFDPYIGKTIEEKLSQDELTLRVKEESDNVIYDTEEH